MIVFHSALAALCAFGMISSKNNPVLLALNTLCLGINVGFVIGYATGAI